MHRTYHGSCHCGVVRFEADIDLAAGTNKCNCTLCTKTRNWNALLEPSALRVLAGDEALTDYQWGPKFGHYLFCRHCGVHPFNRGFHEDAGGHYVVVQLAALDDLDPADLAVAPVRYANGREGNWAHPPMETRHR